MKKRLFLLFLFSALYCSAQQSSWLWQKQSSTSGGANDVMSSTTDGAGNTYLAGIYGYSLGWGSYSVPFDNIWDGFFAKYDPNGNVLWLKNVSGPIIEYCTDIKVDTNGDVYIAAVSQSTLVSIGSYTIANPGNARSLVFIKTDASGNLLWVKLSQGADVFGTKMAIVNHELLMAGFYNSQQPLVIGSSSLSPAPSTDIFLAKFDSNGNVIWLKKDGGMFDEELVELSLSPTGDFYISGGYTGSVTTLGTYTLTAPGYLNNDNAIYIAKYNSSGNILWAKGIYEPHGSHYATSIKADPAGNVFIAGSYGSKIVFDTYTLTNTGNGDDAFIAKFNASGNTLWAKGIGGNLTERFTDVETDATGNVYLSGTYQSTLLTIGNYTLSNDTNVGTFNYTSNMLVLVYNGAGQVLKVESAGNKFGNDNASCISLDPSGNIVLSGWYSGPNTVIGSNTLTNPGNKNTRVLFLAKMGGLDVGIKENTLLNNSINLYPNPNKGLFKVVSPKIKINSLTVLDLNGKIISETYPPNENEFEVDLSGNAPGIYFVQIKTPKGILSKKILIQ